MSDDPLRELETAARESMLRTPPRSAGAEACSAERLLVSILIDVAFGLACLFVVWLSIHSLVEQVAPNMPARAIDSLFSLFTACCPLAYSAMDWLIGNTPGKAMTDVRIDAPLGSRTRLLKRWAIKGAPFIAAGSASALELSQTVRIGVPLFIVPQYLLVVAVWCMMLGCFWWLVASVVITRAGQTFPDALAGTRLVRRGARPSTQGFEPLLAEGHRNN